VTAPTLSTSIGDFALHEYRLTLGTRSFSFLHTGAVVTMDDEQRYLAREEGRIPYGAMLWPASIALAHDLAEREAQLRGRRVLELGAGTGLPGIVAAALGAHVLQIDRSEVALHLCTSNAARNTVSVEAREAEWETFHSEQPFDLIVGADVLYVTPMHARLKEICQRYLAPEGCVLFADPFRSQSLPMLEAMEADGFRVSLAKWTLTVEGGTRNIAVYEARRR
jgi:methyltransferase-like protein 23